MKKIIAVLSLFILSIYISATPVEAHVLASDGNIGAVLHVDPDDNPIAGQQSGFFFEFKDKQNKFTPQNCDCTFVVIENGKTIYTQPLFQSNSNPSLSSASVFYTFPQRDVYEVDVIGKPLTPHAFQQFKLVWNWRVDQQASQQSTSVQSNHNFFSAHISHFIILGTIILAFFIYLIINTIKKRNPNVKGGEKKNDKEDISNVY
jgi:hypothetical protein